MITKLKNNVLFHVVNWIGYGGETLSGSDVRVIFDNRLLEEKKFHHCCDRAVWLDRKTRKYKRLTAEKLQELAAGKPQAFQLCDECEKPMQDGWVSQFCLLRCKSCAEKTPGELASPEVVARGKLNYKRRCKEEEELAARKKSLEARNGGSNEED